MLQKHVALSLGDNFELVTRFTDYMDESLIMIKRKMCWTHQDIVYSPLNKRKIKSKDAVEKLAKKNENNEIDQALFKDSNETLWKGIEKENPDLIREVKHLQEDTVRYYAGFAALSILP